MEVYEFVILGGGVAAGYAARELASRGIGQGGLAIICAEPAVCYDRSALSKSFLDGRSGADDHYILSPAFCSTHGIVLRPAWGVVGIDFRRRLLMNGQGEVVGFRKLMLATGSRVRKLSIPGADLPGVFYLRTLRDATALREQLSQARHAVVIGGGFIGTEVAARAAMQHVQTVLVHAEEHLWPEYFTPEISTFFKGYYQSHDVQLIPSAKPESFRGGERVSQVVLEAGLVLPADVVVVGIGADPETSLFRQTGLQLDQGVVTNRYLETNIDDVWAVGDIAQYDDVLFGCSRRIDHWDNARLQGRHAARGMLGLREPYLYVPYFSSEIFDVKWEFWGDTKGTDYYVYRGDLSQGSISTWWFVRDRVRAAFVMGRPDAEREAAPRLIGQASAVQSANVAEEECPPEQWAVPSVQKESGLSLAY